MNHVLSVVVAAATIGAMANIDKIDISSIDISGVSDDGVKDAQAFLKTPLVREVIDNNFSQLVSNIYKEDVRLIDIYASIQSSGKDNTLFENYSTGTQNSASGKVFTRTSNKANASCHGNHSSRGWR